MALKSVTRDELTKLLIAELAKDPSGVGVKSIGLYHVIEPGHSNWSLGPCNFGEADAAHCAGLLAREVLPRFQAIYTVTW